MGLWAQFRKINPASLHFTPWLQNNIQLLMCLICKHHHGGQRFSGGHNASQSVSKSIIVHIFKHTNFTWSCHGMEMLSALLPLCNGNPQTTTTNNHSITLRIGQFKSGFPCQICWALMCLLLALTNSWTNCQFASDLRCHDTHKTSF